MLGNNQIPFQYKNPLTEKNSYFMYKLYLQIQFASKYFASS